jgi:endoglucanase
MKMNRPAFKIDTENPGSEIAGEAAPRQPCVSSEQRIQPIRRTFSAMRRRFFAALPPRQYIDVILVPDYYNSSGRRDELIWSALWLIRRPAKARVLKGRIDLPRTFRESFNALDPFMGRQRYGATILLAQLTKARPTCGGSLVELLIIGIGRANRIHATVIVAVKT